MTTITIFTDRNKDCVGFEMKGHAGYDRSGSDIVCAAISMLAVNTHNSLEVLLHEPFAHEEDEELGYMYLMLMEHPSTEAKLLLNSMVLGLKELEKQYGKSGRFSLQKSYLKLKFKEV